MTEPPSDNQPPSDDAQTLWNVRKEMLAAFSGDAFPPFQVSADDLVRVTVDAQCRLREVSLYGAGLDPDVRERLENAILEAVNDGLRHVALRYGERLTEVVKEARAS